MRFFIPGRNGCSSSGCVWVLVLFSLAGVARAGEVVDPVSICLEAELAQRLGGVTVGTEGAGF
ncbi:MAG TPA: hypothetical protein PKN08_12685, partial [Opitutaceae bacterium]|nr:hypothetical protein [Opitutaceae bacterium]